MEEVWEAPNARTSRVLRLAIGTGLGAAFLFGGFWFLSVASKVATKEAEEDPVDVTLVSTPEDKPPPPEPIPEAAPVAMNAAPAAAPAPAAQSIYDTDKPPDKLPDPKPGGGPSNPDPYSGPRSDAPPGNGPPGSTGTGTGPAAPPGPPAPAKPSGPMRVDESVTPPVSVSMPAPPYPEAAKAAGIEGTVVVKYVVSETGSVTSAEVLRGPAELGAACVQTVKTWKFKPAIFDGHPVSVVRQAKFPFHIKT